MTLYLVRGLPGSGKSTLAKRLAHEYNAKHFEADQFFTDVEGNYYFVGEFIGQAHDWCLENTYAELENGSDVIVSNTFTRYSELKPYLLKAAALNIDVVMIECLEEYGNIHNVPERVLENMRKRFTTNEVLSAFIDDCPVTYRNAKEYEVYV